MLANADLPDFDDEYEYDMAAGAQRYHDPKLYSKDSLGMSDIVAYGTDKSGAFAA